MKEFKGIKGLWSRCTRTNHVETKSDDRRELQGIQTICSVNSLFCSDEEAKANAQLISKAPEMLEMLCMNVDKLELSNLDFFNKYGFNVSELHDKNIELIKEATDLNPKT